jgi:hypothetical protein
MRLSGWSHKILHMPDRSPSLLSWALCALIVLVAWWGVDRWRARLAAEPATLARYLRTVAADQERAGPRYRAMIGDSITVAGRLLPVCDGPVLKAAFNGAQVQHAVDHIILPLRSRPPAAILIAIGVNDAWRHIVTPRAQRLTDFAASYRRLIREAQALTPDVGLLLVPPVAKDGALGASFFDMTLIEAFNQIIVELAADAKLPTFSLAPLAGPDGLARAGTTTDGVHLTAAGYAIWMDVVTRAWSRIMPCG